MALQFMGIIDIIPSNNILSKNKKKGYIGALITGLLAGLFASPCSTPVLAALLLIVSGSGNIIYGILLLLLYSIGHSVLVIIAGTSIKFVQNLSKNNKYKVINNIIKYVFGSLMILLALYFIKLGI